MAAHTPALAIVGGYPPPHGGVTTHTRRLCALLDERGIDYRVYNAVSGAAPDRRVISVAHRRLRWLLGYLLTGREPAVYLMSRRLMVWLVGALLVMLRGKRVMLRLQNAQLIDWARQSPLRHRLAALALRRMSGVVCVRPALAAQVAACGVPPARIHAFPGFLPPGAADHERAAVHPGVWEFAAGGRPLIVANGKVGWHAGGDLYGLDLLVELAARLKPDVPALRIVVCFWDHLTGDDDYLDELRRRARERGLGGEILFNTQSGLFVPVLAAADLFVRPTLTDGDASSIREALHLGVRVVASDAAERPAGTALFRTGDLEDFETQVRAALSAAAPEAGVADPDAQRRVEAYVRLISEFCEPTPAGEVRS